MKDVKFIASVAERDIDLIVMEELSVNEEFRDWFSTRACGAAIFESEIGAWHSVTEGALGESDIIYLFVSQSGQRIALLIENKISAPPQPEQGARYRLRGESGIVAGHWDSFRTCAIAPSRYLNSSQHDRSYDSQISYEEILAFFSSRRFRDARFRYKGNLIQEAIEQNRRGYQAKFSEEMTQFVAAYHAFVESNFPALHMQDAEPRPAGSTWIMFRPEGIPKTINVCHQMTAGKLKIFLSQPKGDVAFYQSRYPSLSGFDIEISEASRSISLAIDTPKLQPMKKTFVKEKALVAVALEKLSVLVTAVRNEEGEFI